MSLKTPKTLRKCEENLQPQMAEAQFLKALIFLGLFKSSNWVNFSSFSYLKFFSVFIVKDNTILWSKHGTRVNIYVKKWRLLLVSNLTK